jgi:hypothetical protein
MRAEENKANYHKRADTRSLNDIQEIDNTGKSPHSTVDIEIIKTNYFGYQNKRQHPIKQVQVLMRDIKIESHQMGNIEGTRQEKNIHSQNQKEVLI